MAGHGSQGSVERRLTEPGIMPRMVLQGIRLERDSRVPLRRQLVGHLQSRILGGEIAPGRRLPSLRRAEELLGLHRNTIASAYRDLVHNGLVHARPGSGIYVRAASDVADAGVAGVMAHGRHAVDLVCSDLHLGTVLKAELERRMAVRVWISSREQAPAVRLRLAPSAGFVRWVKMLPRPSVVAVVSRSDLIHRLMSIAVLIHGRERIGYLPTSPADRRAMDRLRRLSTHVVADYAELELAQRLVSRDVQPTQVISSISVTSLGAMLRRFEARPGGESGRSNCRNDPCEKVSKQP